MEQTYWTTVGEIDRVLDALVPDSIPMPPQLEAMVPDYWKDPGNHVLVTGWGMADLDPGNPENGPMPDIIWFLTYAGEASRSWETVHPGEEAGGTMEFPAPDLLDHHERAVTLRWCELGGGLVQLRLRKVRAVPQPAERPERVEPAAPLRPGDVTTCPSCGSPDALVVDRTPTIRCFDCGGRERVLS